MRLKHITFTGIDAKTDIQELIDIQREYPIAEFGVLTSYHWYENGNRYLDPLIINDLRGNGLNLALHVCGSAAHDAAVGRWDLIDKLVWSNIDLFHRIQLNISNRKDNPEALERLPKIVEQEVIIQTRDGANTSIYDATIEKFREKDKFGRTFSMLLDASGGQGIDTPLKVLPSSGKVGYAGGFNPGNVGEKLTFLLQNVRMGQFWIDMESGVRTDDWFDTAKVRRVLATCKEVIRDFGMEE
jgi:hypothetical protein